MVVMEFVSLVRTTPQEAAKLMGMKARSGILRSAGAEHEHSGGAYGTSHGQNGVSMNGGVEDTRSGGRARKDADGGAVMAASSTALEQGDGSIGVFSATSRQHAARIPLRDRAKGVSAFFREDNQRYVYMLLGALVALLVAVSILSFVVVANHSRTLAPSQSPSPTVMVGTSPNPSTTPTPVDGSGEQE